MKYIPYVIIAVLFSMQFMDVCKKQDAEVGNLIVEVRTCKSPLRALVFGF